MDASVSSEFSGKLGLPELCCGDDAGSALVGCDDDSELLGVLSFSLIFLVRLDW